jgi:uncharacterized membrane protein
MLVVVNRYSSPGGAMRMNDKTRYLQLLSLVCLVLAVFAICIMAIGYQPWSIGHIVTLILLIVGCVVCYRLSKRNK